MRNHWIIIIALFIFALDQSAKWLIKTSLRLFQSVPVLGQDFFRLTYIENEGIIFGMPFGSRIFLTLITVFAIIFLIYYIVRMNYAPAAPKIALGLILGGAFGNFTDRLLYGRVVDFLDFDFPDFIMERWFVFNLADASVNLGMTVLIIYLLFFDHKYLSKNSAVPADNFDTADKNIVPADQPSTLPEPANEYGNRGSDHCCCGKTEEGTD